MQAGKEAIAAQIADSERRMNAPDFWADIETLRGIDIKIKIW